MEPTPQDWAKWQAHKSNKEQWIEAQELAEEEDPNIFYGNHE